LVWTAHRAWQQVRSDDPETKASGAMLSLCLLNIVYVVAISSAVTFLESSRYRYQIESLMWVTSSACAADLGRVAARRLRGQPGDATRNSRPSPIA
jgi:hypothetical protein